MNLARFEGKVFSLLHTRFSEAVLLDCDNIPFVGARGPGGGESVRVGLGSGLRARAAHLPGLGCAHAPPEAAAPAVAHTETPPDPAALFDEPDYIRYGNLFWPDFWAVVEKKDLVFDMVGLDYDKAAVRVGNCMFWVFVGG